MFQLIGPDVVAEPAELESAVKECVDEVIRKHNLRATTQLPPGHENEANPDVDATSPKDDISQPLESSLPQSLHHDAGLPYNKQPSAGSDFTSPQLSPFANPNHRYPPDFHRADSDPLSPRAAAAHFRSLPFSQETSPIKRDFGPFGPFPVHPGLPLPNPFHHQLNQQLTDLHIQRCAVALVCAFDVVLLKELYFLRLMTRR